MRAGNRRSSIDHFAIVGLARGIRYSVVLFTARQGRAAIAIVGPRSRGILEAVESDIVLDVVKLRKKHAIEIEVSLLLLNHVCFPLC